MCEKCERVITMVSIGDQVPTLTLRGCFDCTKQGSTCPRCVVLQAESAE